MCHSFVYTSLNTNKRRDERCYFQVCCYVKIGLWLRGWERGGKEGKEKKVHTYIGRLWLKTLLCNVFKLKQIKMFSTIFVHGINGMVNIRKSYQGSKGGLCTGPQTSRSPEAQGLLLVSWEFCCKFVWEFTPFKWNINWVLHFRLILCP